MEVTRFAPSPTGPLHLGHALAAVVAWTQAQLSDGRFLLRIDDLDQTRCRRDFEIDLKEDLTWLGLSWPEPTRRQSEHLSAYAEALTRLRSLGVLYPCFCSRAEIEREMAAAASAPHGLEGSVYPGTCRSLSETRRNEFCSTGRPHAWRLDAAKAAALAGPLVWHDRRHGPHSCTPRVLGDVVLARKDTSSSYHLAVVIDDAAQGITLVTRGDDLLPSTHVHRLLQHLLGLPVPEWLHHPLVRDAHGHRLAKRDEAMSLRALRAQGLAPAQVLGQIDTSLLPQRLTQHRTSHPGKPEIVGD